VNSAPPHHLPNITVAQLQYLVAAVDASTWAEAAAHLGVTQSALSQGLAELQRRVGVVLFERQGRRRVPAAAAEPMVDHARRVLAQTADLLLWADGIRAGASGRVRIGMIDAAAVDHFGNALRRFRHDSGDVELHLTVAPSSQLVESLARGELDLAVCVEPGRDDLTTERLLAEPLLAYPPPGEHSSRPSSWGPWVSFPVGSVTRRLIDNGLRARGASFDVVADSHQPEVLREMVRLGLGWTVLPPVQAEREPHPLRPIDDRPIANRHLVVATRDGALPNPAADRLIEELRHGD